MTSAQRGQPVRFRNAIPLLHRRAALRASGALLGILSAIILRGIMIVSGVALIQHFAWVLYPFGTFIVFAGLRMLLRKDKAIHLPAHRWRGAGSFCYRFAVGHATRNLLPARW
jgi:predicted tellurium resistance membrane protein TerC